MKSNGLQTINLRLTKNLLQIYRPRIYLFGKPEGLRGLTIIGIAITPTVKRQSGATTINIDSKDINEFLDIT